MSSVLDEHGGVESKDSSLIGLGDISEDHVNHGHEHSVFLGMSGILDDGDDVGSLLSHVHEISSGSLGELDTIDGTFWSDEVSDMGAGSS